MDECKPLYTGRCVCLVDQRGQRTMRPSLEDSIRLQPDEVKSQAFQGSKWVGAVTVWN